MMQIMTLLHQCALTARSQMTLLLPRTISLCQL
jgi:hypothetical protein